MGSLGKEKLNWLQRNLPEGLPADTQWFQGHGFSRQLLRKYVQGGWLLPVARGVYRRPAAKLPVPDQANDLQWQHVVISLQNLMDYPVAVGGRTALELQGFGHYLSATSSREVHVYRNRKNPPGWVSRLNLGTRLVFHRATRLFEHAAISPGLGKRSDAPNADAWSAQTGLTKHPWGHWNWPLILSTPERAILELLDEVPQRETFHQAEMFMEGLSNLSPRRLHTLLVDCRSVKVKRLFLWFAERHNHAWLKKLERTSIDLGRGKRMLVRGGKLDKKFSITVPETMDAHV
jgi:hypothetical protein